MLATIGTLLQNVNPLVFCILYYMLHATCYMLHATCYTTMLHASLDSAGNARNNYIIHVFLIVINIWER